MKTTFVSTTGISSATRQSMLKLQSDLVTAQKEVASGRHADVGLTLGAQTAQTISLRQEHSRLKTIIDTNALVTSRLDATQSAIGDIAGNADGFLQSLITATGAGRQPGLITGLAASALGALTGTLNSTQNGEYLFAGINTDVKPISDYDATPTSAAKAAVDAAFLAKFGITQDDPAVANISATDMSDFLDNQFATLFDPAGWSSTWSSATDGSIKSRISPSELVETGASANAQGIRKVAMALTMMVGTGADKLSDAAYKVVTDKATALLGSAGQDLTQLQAQVGTAQDRVTKANDRMSTQLDILTNHVDALESVDPYEASTRVNDLMTQIETAYALTAQIKRLSILNYL